MIIRGTGHIADPHDVYRPVSDLVGTSVAAPPVSDGCLEYCHPVPVDQGDEEDCVAEAIPQATYALLGIEGKVQVKPSSRTIWFFARKRMGNEEKNVGCRPIDAFIAMDSLGWPTEDEWPRSRPFNEQPDEEALRFAQDHESIETGRILTVGTEREDELKTTLNSPLPVCAAFAVDDAYMGNSDGFWIPGGTPRGWHYLFLTHYDRDGVWTQGSYGIHHGQSGFVRIPWYVIRDPSKCKDLWAIRFSGVQRMAA